MLSSRLPDELKLVAHPAGVCTKRDRILLVLLAKAVRAWRQALLIVQPETLLRCHRQGFRIFWKQKSHGMRNEL